ncbi:MAG: exo-alpha-sialidase, partial [Prevotella sp.]|nr:exo-alpha-sialidase [Prevotella sp.]
MKKEARVSIKRCSLFLLFAFIITYASAQNSDFHKVEKGDANNDGVVNVTDIVKVVNDIMGSNSDIYISKADANDDGIVDVSDVVVIVNTILNSPDNTPKYKDTSEEILDYVITDNIVDIGNSGGVKQFSIFQKEMTSKLRPVFRVPNIVVTNSGSLLVAAENREIVSDRGERDIVVTLLRTNNRNKVLVKRVWQEKGFGRYNNPTFVIDRDGRLGPKGRIFLFVGHFNQGSKYGYDNTTEDADIVYKYSDDDGITWSDEVSLKGFWDTSKYTSAIPSPANGLIDDEGTIWLPTMVVKDGRWASGIFYKRKYGDWTFSSPTVTDDNECTLYFDKNNQVVLDCRTYKKERHKYYYDINSDTFTKASDNIFPFECINIKADIKLIESVYVMTFPDTKRGKRENITLYGSQDGTNWEKIVQLMDFDAVYG